MITIGSARISGRLDSILCNQQWIDLMPDSFYEYQTLTKSDHGPMLLHLVAPPDSSPKPFKYFNYWMDCWDYKRVIE